MITHHMVTGSERKRPITESPYEIQKRLKQEFELFDDWTDRYQTLIECGRRLSPMPNALKTEYNRIQNCRGDTWFAGQAREGILYLWASSDTDIVAGLLALVVESYSGRPAVDAADHSCSVLDAIGLKEHLSPHRLAALQEITDRLEQFARGIRGAVRAPST